MRTDCLIFIQITIVTAFPSSSCITRQIDVDVYQGRARARPTSIFMQKKTDS
jgi:hypothetical protein